MSVVPFDTCTEFWGVACNVGQLCIDYPYNVSDPEASILICSNVCVLDFLYAPNCTLYVFEACDQSAFAGFFYSQIVLWWLTFVAALVVSVGVIYQQKKKDKLYGAPTGVTFKVQIPVAILITCASLSRSLDYTLQTIAGVKTVETFQLEASVTGFFINLFWGPPYALELTAYVLTVCSWIFMYFKIARTTSQRHYMSDKHLKILLISISLFVCAFNVGCTIGVIIDKTINYRLPTLWSYYLWVIVITTFAGLMLITLGVFGILLHKLVKFAGSAKGEQATVTEARTIALSAMKQISVVLGLGLTSTLIVVIFGIICSVFQTGMSEGTYNDANGYLACWWIVKWFELGLVWAQIVLMIFMLQTSNRVNNYRNVLREANSAISMDGDTSKTDGSSTGSSSATAASSGSSANTLTMSEADDTTIRSDVIHL